MALWTAWRDAIWLLRPAFSRMRSFMWFATVEAGLTVRTDLLGDDQHRASRQAATGPLRKAARQPAQRCRPARQAHGAVGPDRAAAVP